METADRTPDEKRRGKRFHLRGGIAGLRSAPVPGLYRFDLLNVPIPLLAVPFFFAEFSAHRKANLPYALPGLAMIELSRKSRVSAGSGDNSYSSRSGGEP